MINPWLVFLPRLMISCLNLLLYYLLSTHHKGYFQCIHRLNPIYKLLYLLFKALTIKLNIYVNPITFFLLPINYLVDVLLRLLYLFIFLNKFVWIVVSALYLELILIQVQTYLLILVLFILLPLRIYGGNGLIFLVWNHL